MKETKTNAVNEVKSNSNIVKCTGCKIIGVSSPSTIARIAEDKGINPQEVFVRVRFAYNGHEFTVSNKLKFLTKTGYKKLLDAVNTETVMTLAVNVESGFFYIENDATIDDLFKEESEKPDIKKALAALII